MALLRMDGITKVFPGVVANDSISFDLQRGEIHALVGENGAGKTTLMKILYGLYAPDAGEIYIRDEKVRIQNPRDAIKKGVGMVHQHFMLVRPFTVTENIILGEENTELAEAEREDPSVVRRILGRIRRVLSLDIARPMKRIAELMETNRIQVDQRARIEDLPVGLQQRVEILKVLYRGAEILVFDEPTAVLTPQEVEELFNTFRRLTEQGKAIIFITHKLDEVLQVADRITVIRRGTIVETLPRAEADKQKLAELMVGKPVLLSVENPPPQPGEVALEVAHVSFRNEDGILVLHDINFEIREGEVFGIAGVEGNGQNALARVLMERVELESGVIRLYGEDLGPYDIRERRDRGVGFIPDDRSRYGLILPFSLADNLVLGRHHRPPFVGNLQFIQRQEIQRFARQAIADYDIRTPSEAIPAHALSGGNQQKVIVARELSSGPKLLVASQPTRGVDVGAMEFIYRQLVSAKEQKKAVLLISADLDEVMSMSDRIGVIYKGRIIKIFDRASANKEEVGFYMMGEKGVSA
ncbi:MAG: ABC transporter ATP-binding protein [Spirochaetaceae bacterium]